MQPVVSYLAPATLAGLVGLCDAHAESRGPADRGETWQQHGEPALAHRIPPQIAGKVETVPVGWKRVDVAHNDARGHPKGEGLIQLDGSSELFVPARRPCPQRRGGGDPFPDEVSADAADRSRPRRGPASPGGLGHAVARSAQRRRVADRPHRPAGLSWRSDRLRS